MKFTFPLEESVRQALANEDEKTVIVSIVGKSDLRSLGSKGGPADETCDRQVFTTRKPTQIPHGSSILIEGYHDKTNKIMFLHLRSPYDSSHFADIIRQEDDESKSFQELMSECRAQQAKAMLFLMTISHIVVLSSPSPRFETQYLQLFRTLDYIRSKAQSLIAEQLNKVPGVSSEWAAQQRMCTPRLLFYFQSNQLDRSKFLKRLEHSMEDQIYRLLRRCRTIQNSTNASLFAIPPNQEFVFIEDQDLNVLDKTQQAVNRALRFCLGSTAEAPETISTPPKNVHRFKDFLLEHVNTALGRGYDDSLGRHNNSSHFEVPPLSVWAEAANGVYKVFLGEETSSKQRQVLTSLSNSFNASIRFSEARCKKVLPLAFAAYEEGLPPHYTKAYHEQRVAFANSLFLQQARGPSCSKYLGDLRQHCDEHWHNGRQVCEVLSLTGNPCTQPLHMNVEGEEPCQTALAKNEPLTTMPHSSGVRYVSTCNCGRKQGPREDPFVLRIANCEFYAALAVDCCSNLSSWTFPVFEPSIDDFKAARVDYEHPRKDSFRLVQEQKLSLGGPLSEIEDAARLKQSDGSSDQELLLQIEDLCLDPGKDKGLLRQASTTEYLPGMLHTASPAGLLPQFPSWSLVCLGPSSVYSHNHGLTDQAGFLPGSAYLLPWDVNVRFEPSELGKKCEAKWTMLGVGEVNIPVSPNQQRKFSGNINKRKTKVGKDHIEFSLKIFIGVEYECPRGHRFMLSSPDKMLKATGSGIVKETGTKVVTNDMPLYCLCPCNKNSKPLLAQLMRIHVVTPKAPVHVTLNPKVQPAPDPCPVFVSGLNEPLVLTQSAYWILRLPFAYMAEQNLYRVPKETVPLNYGRLLAGCYSIIPAAI